MKVDLLDFDNFSVVLFNQMVEEAGDECILEKFGLERGDTVEAELEVIFKINGVEVDFAEAAVSAFQGLVEDFDEKVLEKAEQLLEDKLVDLIDSIEDVRNNLHLLNMTKV